MLWYLDKYVRICCCLNILALALLPKTMKLLQRNVAFAPYCSVLEWPSRERGITEANSMIEKSQIVGT